MVDLFGDNIVLNAPKEVNEDREQAPSPTVSGKNAGKGTSGYQTQGQLGPQSGQSCTVAL